jgi:S1-C subfamily serine protease
MSESDQTWNADGEPHQHAWPQYSWPEDATEPVAAPEPPAVSSSEPNFEYPADPPTAPTPWAAPAPWPPTSTPAAPVATAPPSSSKTRRGLAVLAALALVLASAGIGAGVAIALHNPSDTTNFRSDNNTNTVPPGNSGGGNFGGGNLGGNGTGTVPSGSGSLDLSAIASKVNPALVNINTTLAQGRAAGTGMLISSTGEILTNNHVIADATSIKVVIGGNGASHDAKVVGYDVTEDVALIQITDKLSGLPTISVGNPSQAQIGDAVAAIGNALGQGGTPKASQGQITALDQEVTAGDAGGEQETLEGMIQINAPIQPGDSGGALVEASGKILGMNTAAASSGGRFNSQTGSNVGFAIPIDKAVAIVHQIESGNETDKIHIGDRALLGVQAQDADGTNPAAPSGALVVGVQADSGAASAGLKDDDVIVTINGKTIADSAGLRSVLSKLHVGDSVSVGWVDSSGTHHDGNVKLVAGPPL